MNQAKRNKMIKRYCEDKKRLKLAYHNVFTSPDAYIVIMDLIQNQHLFDRSVIQHEHPLYSAGFGDGKKSSIQRILELSGIEDNMLRTIDPSWSGEDV
jgi:hypothetical protein